MNLEEVQNHPFRQDIYIDRIITPSDKIAAKDRYKIKRILMEEFSINKSLFISFLNIRSS